MFVDSDVIFALLKPSDRNAFFAKQVVSSSEQLYSSIAVMLELEIVVKRELSDYFSKRILEAVLEKIPKLNVLPVDKNIFSKSLELRQKFQLGIFDSMHAAVALEHDKKIASTDHAFDRVTGLERIKPLAE